MPDPSRWEAPTPLRLSASHMGRMADSAAAFEPQRENNGIIVVDGLAGWNWPTDISGDSAITLALESFPLPSESNAVMEMHYMNEVQKAPSKTRLEELEVVVKDFVDVEIAARLLEWRRRVTNPTITGGGVPTPATQGAKIPPMGGLGLCADFKTMATILLMAPNGGYQRAYTLMGVWPSALSHGNIDMASESQVKLTITLQADRISDHNMTVGEAYPF